MAKFSAVLSRPDKLGFQLRELLGDLAVVFDVVADGAHGMQDRRVIAAAEVTADFFQAVSRMTTGQVHAYLPRKRDALVALLALKIGQANVVVLGHVIQDLLDR